MEQQKKPIITIRKYLYFSLLFILAGAIPCHSGYQKQLLANIYTKPKLKSFKNYTQSMAKKYPGHFILHGQGSKKRLALTFDDGPDPKTLPILLTLLKKHAISATFFFQGSNMIKYPGITREVIRQGHEIGNHSFSHPDCRKISFKAFVEDEFKTTQAIIKRITGKTATLMRPPYGVLTKRQIEYLKDRKIRIINWSIDSQDWIVKPDNEHIRRNVCKLAHPDGIVLLHTDDGYRPTRSKTDSTLKVLPEIISNLKEKGYSFVPVSKLLSQP